MSTNLCDIESNVLSHSIWQLRLNDFTSLYIQCISKVTQSSNMANCKSRSIILIIFFMHPFFSFFFFLIFHSTSPLLSFLHHVLLPHCLLVAATAWLHCRHWPRPLRRPKSNILTCLLPEWWFIKKQNWPRKRIDWTQVILIIIVTHQFIIIHAGKGFVNIGDPEWFIYWRQKPKNLQYMKLKLPHMQLL